MSVRFGDCRLDVDARRLFRGSREVHHSPKAFELLKLLVETRLRRAADDLVRQRFMRGEDVPAVLQRAEQIWNAVVTIDARKSR